MSFPAGEGGAVDVTVVDGRGCDAPVPGVETSPPVDESTPPPPLTVLQWAWRRTPQNEK